MMRERRIIADSARRIVVIVILGAQLESPAEAAQRKAPPKRGLFCPLRARPQINQEHSATEERHTQVTAPTNTTGRTRERSLVGFHRLARGVADIPTIAGNLRTSHLANAPQGAQHHAFSVCISTPPTENCNDEQMRFLIRIKL